MKVFRCHTKASGKLRLAGVGLLAVSVMLAGRMEGQVSAASANEAAEQSGLLQGRLRQKAGSPSGRTLTDLLVSTQHKLSIDINDVSPVLGNYPADQHSPSGRVLSLAVSGDGSRLYAGTLAGVWRLDEPEQKSPLPRWRHLQRPQPSPGVNPDVPGALEVPSVIHVVVSPVNRDIVLAATTKDARIQSREGIYLSEDGGESWQLVRPGPVGQIVFAPDIPDIVYAAVGNGVAISFTGGRDWRETIPIAGEVWHLAVDFDRIEGRTRLRRVYAAGPNQIWFSTDGGATWARDTSPVFNEITRLGGSFGTFPFEGSGGSASAQMLAFDPRNPEQLYLAVRGNRLGNGRRYYYQSPLQLDGPRSTPELGLQEVSLWVGDYSNFSANKSASWEQVLGPPIYSGGSTASGRPYVLTKITPRGYLVFMADLAHVHVAEIQQPTETTKGKPEDASWHRLDGQDVSERRRESDLTDCRPNQSCNKLFVHADPHAIEVSPVFNIRLKPVTDLPFPYDRNSELDTSEALCGTEPVCGAIWMANDGGVYRSVDGGATWELLPGLPTLPMQKQYLFAGAALRNQSLPALYFGVPDNDDFFTVDGGRTWRDDPQEGCGDCPPYFSDPLQPSRVLKAGRIDCDLKVGGEAWRIYDSTVPFEYPDPTNSAHVRCIPLPAGSRPLVAAGYLKGYYNPIVLTLASEAPLPNGDYILIRQVNPTTRVLLRARDTINQITAPGDWDVPSAKVSKQGEDLPSNDIDTVQASGGHTNTVFYVGNGERVWVLDAGSTAWRQIVDGTSIVDGISLVARRFFAHPYDSNIIYILSDDGILRSNTLGQTWQRDISLDRAVTENGVFSYVGPVFDGNTAGETFAINAMIFDHREMGTRFAVGNAGVFFTLDGISWERLLSSTALPGYPVAAYFDSISRFNRALYVAVHARGILQLRTIPEIVNDQFPQPTVNTSPVVPGGGPAGTFIITAIFANHSSTPIVSPFFQVIELSGGNLLLNADGGVPGGVGATLTPSDDFLPAGDSFTVNFKIGLQTRQRFTFKVNLIGVKTE